MLIGTHNSASYSFNFDVSFWDKKNKWEWLRMTAKYFSTARTKILNITQNQNKTVWEQLDAGARILDLRVSFASGIFYTSHTFCCDPFTAILGQIRSFLKEKRDTLAEDFYIIILVSPDYENQGTMIGRENLLLDLLLAELREVSDKVRLIYKPLQVSLDYYRSIAHINTVETFYYDVPSVDAFKKRFGETEFGDESILHCILTPPTQLNQLSDVSLEKYARELNPAVSYLLKEREAEGRQLPDGCIFDFFDAEITR